MKKFQLFFLTLSPWSNVWRVSSLKSHSLCQNSKVAVTKTKTPRSGIELPGQLKTLNGLAFTVSKSHTFAPSHCQCHRLELYISSCLSSVSISHHVLCIYPSVSSVLLYWRNTPEVWFPPATAQPVSKNRSNYIVYWNGNMGWDAKLISVAVSQTCSDLYWLRLWWILWCY